VRVITATNANLEAELRAGHFREDLYYRLNVIPIMIPPLRQRKTDIPPLVHHLIRRFNQEYGRCIERISEETMALLLAYQWPGNVRELENILGRAIINMRLGDTVIEAGHLPVLVANSVSPGLEMGEATGVLMTMNTSEGSFEELQREWEKAVLQAALQRTGGNKTKAAQQLKMSIRNFYYKLEKYGLL